MFAKHQKTIAAYAQRDAESFARVMSFVILTVRMPINRVPTDMRDLDQKGSKSGVLWGWKREAFSYVQDHKERIYSDAMELFAIADPYEAERQLLAYFAELPGFGLVKGGFVVQLAFGLGGCLDTHNVVRFGLNINHFKSTRFKNAKRWSTRYKVVDLYQSLLAAAGGCETLWNEWCSYVAENQGYGSAFEVSALHCEALGLPA